jgi:hypothetical protein
MGGERTGKRKRVLCYIAFVTCLLISGCALLERTETQGRLSQGEAQQHLVQAQNLLTRGEYEASLQENQAALSLSGNKPPGDEALFNMGLIYIHPGNPGKDYAKSVDAFMRLITEYPKGALTEQARVLVQVVQEIDSVKRTSLAATQENEKLKRTSLAATQENEKLKRTSLAATQENEKLKRTLAEAVQENERLKRVIEQSTKVDIEIEEKKKEKAR